MMDGAGGGDGPARGEARQMPVLSLLPNMVTIIGLCFGLTAIRFAFEGRFEVAATLLILASLIDATDGLLARRLNASSSFGAELDSLSDFVCFGVAPALLVYRFGLEGLAGLGWVAALLFAICCCLRLARFNVMAKEDEERGSPHFTGVPAPAGAMLCLFPVFLANGGFLDLSGTGWLVAAWVLGVGGLMVAPFRTLSLKAVRVRRGAVVWVLLGAALVVGLMITRIWLFSVLATATYVSILIWGLFALRRR
jgi:CDP-diacylglycerol--serine O-phosphatidyltransferase